MKEVTLRVWVRFVDPGESCGSSLLSATACRYGQVQLMVDGVRIGESPDTESGRAALGQLLMEHALAGACALPEDS